MQSLTRDPDEAVVDSVSMAELLKLRSGVAADTVLLERLSPTERATFIPRWMFGFARQSATAEPDIYPTPPRSRRQPTLLNRPSQPTHTQCFT
ncbi:hypothetical protein EV651_103273 [Kribbella sp. VKM Ac-2571]|nr:hypothetical protein EV651_103273 [Kribbella sp. VKM Ac-2571]